MRIDSHHHFWNYSAPQYPWITPQMEILRRDYGPQQLVPETSHSGIHRVISVQARQSLEETDALLQIAAEQELVAGVVGWVPLSDPKLDEVLERYRDFERLKGVRHVVHDEPDDDFILGDDFNRGIAKLAARELVYDILIFARHLPNTLRFVDQHPEQQFVLDHIGKPTIQRGQFDSQWERGIRELAKRSHVMCKFSGVATEVRDEQWDVELLKPYWDVVWEAFGPRRLMFGSDWPVCLLRTTYATWIDAVSELTGQLSESEADDFWGNNAARAYGISA